MSRLNTGGSSLSTYVILALVWAFRDNDKNEPEGSMDRKKTITRLINYSWNELQAYIASIPPEERDLVSAPDSWSAKDHLAHLAHWQVHFNNQLSRKAKPDVQVTDLDKENLRIYNLYKNKSWQDVVNLVDDASQGFTKHLKALSEDDLNSTEIIRSISNRPLWRTIIGQTIVHVLSHLSMLYGSQGKLEKSVLMQECILEDLQSLDDSPKWQAMNIYNIACAYALAGDSGNAIRLVRVSLELNPELTGWAQEDPDLVNLKNDPDFMSIFPGKTE